MLGSPSVHPSVNPLSQDYIGDVLVSCGKAGLRSKSRGAPYYLSIVGVFHPQTKIDEGLQPMNIVFNLLIS